MKVTLPLTLIYDQKILTAIDTAFNSVFISNEHNQRKHLLNDGYYKIVETSQRGSFCAWCLTYSRLRGIVTGILGIKISHRDFRRLVDKMVKNRDLQRREDTNPKRNLKPVYYLQTDQGRRSSRLKIQHLAIDEREKAYQLLFLYGAIRQASFLSYERDLLENEQELQQFLADIHLSRDDFKVESDGIYLDKKRKSHIIEMIEPIHQIKLDRIEYLEGYRKLEGQCHYRYRLPGISAREFLHKMGLSLALEYIKESISLADVEEYLNLLLKENLIRTVMIFRGELRIDVIDESVRIALRSCWSILRHAIRTMKLIWTNARSPTIQEREWVEMLWGKQVATIFLNECYETLRNQEKDKNTKIYRKMSEEVACTIKEWGYGGLVKIYMKINTQYASVIEQYPIPLEILMRMIYPEFLRNLVAEKVI